jgi:hypothetical protein
MPATTTEKNNRKNQNRLTCSRLNSTDFQEIPPPTSNQPLNA